MNRNRIGTLIALCLLPCAAPAATSDARDIVRSAIDHWRGVSSVSDMTMTIHRSDWQRSMSMRAWTRGDELTLVRVTAPPRDRGNGTLTDGDNMWTFSPKVNRVIRIPSSMMNQSWMGSDFSNKDVSRVDDIVDQYRHEIIGESAHDGHTLYEIQSIPHDDAAVVWGREVLAIRDDHVMVRHDFYDQDGRLVKSMQSLEIGEMGGRVVAIRQRMTKADAADEWTEIRLDAVEYGAELADSVFTLSNLRNPRNP
ncbi:MAG TPA: outer membrane lipoprotein-sorting protein [Woeseiaceae bacterium]|nr:outer membrane lipoprotein-sorting protein [Woeseiaceae bacterium]